MFHVCCAFFSPNKTFDFHLLFPISRRDVVVYFSW